MNYRNLTNSTEALSKLMEKELSFKTSRTLTKIIARIEEELKIYEEYKGKIQEKYIPLDEEGEKIIEDGSFKPTDIEAMYKELFELEETEVEIEHRIDVNDLEDIKITTLELLAIEYLLED